MNQYIAFFLLLLAGYILGYQRAKYVIFKKLNTFQHKIDAMWTIYYNNIGQYIARKVIEGKEDTYLSSENTLVPRDKALVFSDRDIINQTIDKYEKEEAAKRSKED